MKIAVLGYGLEGESLVKYFSSRQAEVTVFYYSNKKAPQNAPINHLPVGVDKINVGSVNGFAGLDFKGYDRVYRTANILPTMLKTNTPVTSSTQEFFDHCPATIIGVTGTKGKGTTSSLIAHILEEAGKKVWLVGNIGTPALEALPSVKKQDYVVFELSSFQLQELYNSPQVAVMLMVVPDHLDAHADMDEYIEAKKQIFSHQKPDDIAVYCDDNEISKVAVHFSKAKTRLPFSNQHYLPNGASLRDGYIYYCAEPVIELAEIPLIGRHNLQNVTAAVAATWRIVGSADVMRRAIKKFKGLPHRLEVVATRGGVRYIDDSISTNPSTAIAAIESIDEPKHLILGGSDKGHDFSELAQAIKIKKNNVASVILIGQMAGRIAKSLEVVNYQTVSQADHLDLAVRLAKKAARPGDVVLLSPACASFDMFSGYSERGEAFKQSVES